MKGVSASSTGLLNKIAMKKKAGEKLKKIFKNVTSYLRSDSYMYSSLLSEDKFSRTYTTMFRASKGGMETKKAGKKNKFLHNIGDYLKSDCYMYALLLACSTSIQGAPENNRALRITQPCKQPGKRRYRKNSSSRSTLIRNTLAVRQEEKCLINPVDHSSAPSGEPSKGFSIPETTTIWSGEDLLKIMKEMS